MSQLWDIWVILSERFNILHEAVIEVRGVKQSFHQIYETHVEMPLADDYIQRLLSLSDIKKEYASLRAEMARSLVVRLRQFDLMRANVPTTSVLLAYCLYFWESFANGYAFEVEIYRDLTESGIAFQAHDIRNRMARFSPYDLQVLNLKGDIKTSSYFLYVGRGQGLPHDFYITRLYEAGFYQSN